MISVRMNHPWKRFFIRRDEISREESSLEEIFIRRDEICIAEGPTFSELPSDEILNSTTFRINPEKAKSPPPKKIRSCRKPSVSATSVSVFFRSGSYRKLRRYSCTSSSVGITASAPRLVVTREAAAFAKVRSSRRRKIFSSFRPYFRTK